MRRCKGVGGTVFLTDTFDVVGHDHPILEELIKEVGIVLVNGNPEFPLLADWANISLACKDDCIENCSIAVDVSHFLHYVVFMGSVILVCSLFVALMVRWSKRMKKKLG